VSIATSVRIALSVLALTITVRPVESQQQAAVRVPRSVLERYVGEYEFPSYTLMVRLHGDTLTSRRVGLPPTVPETPLVPISESRFRQGNQSGWEVEFVI